MMCMKKVVCEKEDECEQCSGAPPPHVQCGSVSAFTRCADTPPTHTLTHTGWDGWAMGMSVRMRMGVGVGESENENESWKEKENGSVRIRMRVGKRK